MLNVGQPTSYGFLNKKKTAFVLYLEFRKENKQSLCLWNVWPFFLDLPVPTQLVPYRSFETGF